ncbi:30S ribosomal protein S4 [Clostridiaceae bacterium HSG29]|nr:30S ribosomal protein S4 [Clostridiaceae bacterium HSG29]
MARYTGPSCRLCRREGQKLFLKGERCYSDKCALNRKATAPGMHGTGRAKLSNYGIQLREKQKVKRFYGLLEKQFKSIFNEAERVKGVTGENFLRLLELRLDNVVFRLGFASSRKEARQLVNHGHFLLNDGKATIPSMTLKVGDVLTIKESSRKSEKIKSILEASVSTPSWVKVDKEKFAGEIVADPTKADIDLPIAEHLIVELYSK